MDAKQHRSQGFTLIATLLLLLLLSGVALGLMYMVNTETRVGGNDLENGLAYHAAEGGMEKMTADLANLFSSSAALKWISGADKVKHFNLPSTRHSRSFCGTCGSALPMTYRLSLTCWIFGSGPRTACCGAA